MRKRFSRGRKWCKAREAYEAARERLERERALARCAAVAAKLPLCDGSPGQTGARVCVPNCLCTRSN